MRDEVREAGKDRTQILGFTNASIQTKKCEFRMVEGRPWKTLTRDYVIHCNVNFVVVGGWQEDKFWRRGDQLEGDFRCQAAAD